MRRRSQAARIAREAQNAPRTEQLTEPPQHGAARTGAPDRHHVRLPLTVDERDALPLGGVRAPLQVKRSGQVQMLVGLT